MRLATRSSRIGLIIVAAEAEAGREVVDGEAGEDGVEAGGEEGRRC